jgi:hypothetical protein
MGNEILLFREKFDKGSPGQVLVLSFLGTDVSVSALNSRMIGLKSSWRGFAIMTQKTSGHAS